jgi:lysozyme
LSLRARVLGEIGNLQKGVKTIRTEYMRSCCEEIASSGQQRSLMRPPRNGIVNNRKDKTMRTLGVDVSHREGNIDWQAARGNPGFAYYKCSDGVKFVDDQFQHNRLGCTDAGLSHAPYHYYQPALDPVAQAEHFIHTAGKDYKRYIVDVEQPEREESITQKLHAFLERVEQLTSTRPAIYTSAGYWNEFIHPKPDWASDYDLIVAHYTLAHQPVLSIGWVTWHIWQFSDYWNFPGCGEVADADWFNGSLEECKAWFGNYQEIDPPIGGSTQLRSQFDQLHIRQLPSVTSREVGHLAKDEIVEVEELAGKDVWIKHSRGWTAVERNGYRYMEVIK